MEVFSEYTTDSHNEFFYFQTNLFYFVHSNIKQQIFFCLIRKIIKNFLNKNRFKNLFIRHCLRLREETDTSKTVG